jgi:hypothetical protein
MIEIISRGANEVNERLVSGSTSNRELLLVDKAVILVQQEEIQKQKRANMKKERVGLDAPGVRNDVCTVQPGRGWQQWHIFGGHNSSI